MSPRGALHTDGRALRRRAAQGASQPVRALRAGAGAVPGGSGRAGGGAPGARLRPRRARAPAGVLPRRAAAAAAGRGGRRSRPGAERRSAGGGAGRCARVQHAWLGASDAGARGCRQPRWRCVAEDAGFVPSACAPGGILVSKEKKQQRPSHAAVSIGVRQPGDSRLGPAAAGPAPRRARRARRATCRRRVAWRARWRGCAARPRRARAPARSWSCCSWRCCARWACPRAASGAGRAAAAPARPALTSRPPRTLRGRVARRCRRCILQDARQV